MPPTPRMTRSTGMTRNSTMANGTDCTSNLVMCRSTQVLVITSCSTHVR